MPTRLINPQFADVQKTQIIADVVDKDNNYLHKQLILSGEDTYSELLLLNPAPPEGYEFDINGRITPTANFALSTLAGQKLDAIRLIESKASEYHALVVGTTDKNREARFALNLECAKKLSAGTASAVEQKMLQIQLDANKAAGHPLLSTMTLQQFAQWIVNFEQLTVLGSGLIESVLIKGRAAVNAAQSIEQIEQVKGQLATEAKNAFAQLQAQLS